MKRTFTFCAFLLVFVFGQALAQERTITGKITSSQDNQPIPGVAVVVEGTTIGTVTDVDGNYKLNIPPNAKRLKFSGVGLKSKTIDISASNNIDMVMEVDVLKLDEVVVTALGISQEKKALSYATQTVDGDQLNQSGSGNLLNELSGKVSNLNVISSSGDPGGGTYMVLRGTRLLTGDNQPLIVVDGVPIDNSINNFDPTNGGNPSQGPGADVLGGVNPDNRGVDINPNDIASITVLKGPAATALYGIQAASGAIIITTKRGGGIAGKKGPAVTFSSSTGWTSANKLPDLQNTYSQGGNNVYAGPTSGYIDTLTGATARRYSWGPPVSTLAWDGVPTVWDKHGSIVPIGTPGSTPVTPYNSEDFFLVGNVFDNNIAIAGGNDKAGYRASIGNIKQTGIVPKTGYVKTTFNLSGQANLSPKFSASAVVTYIESQRDAVQQGSNTSGLMLGLLRTPPTFDNANGFDPKVAADTTASYVQPNGKPRFYRGTAGYDNPYWTVNRNPYHQNLDRVYGATQADYKLYDWMTLTYRLGGDMYLQATKEAYDIGSDAFPTGAIYLNDWANRQFNSDFIIDLHKRFNSNWTGSLILGHNYFTLNATQRQQQGTGFALPTWFDLGNATSYPISSESEATIHRMAEYAQAQVGWKEQLFVTLTGRNEISSTLPASDDVFFYPSASAGWVFTEPLGLATNKVFNYGKLRVSYAKVGKDAPSQALTTPYKTTFVSNGFTTNGGIFWPFNGQAGYANSSPTDVIGNPTLKPYQTTSTEVGLDLSFLQNRISLDATYYNDKTTNEIFTVPTSYTIGNASAVLNAGDITNKGVEISLKTTPVKTKSGFTWDLIINWSKNTNLVDNLYPGVNSLLLGGFTNGGVYALPGQPYGVIYASTYVRTNNKDLNSPMIINDDKNDPGYAMPIGGSENEAIGNIQPKWLGSVLSNISYKGFTLGCQIDVRHGGVIWNGTHGAIDYFGTGADTKDRGATKVFSGLSGHLDANGNIKHYAPDGVTVLDGPGGANGATATLGQYYWQFIGSSFIGPTEPDVQDGSYTKLRQVSLTYALPKSWVRKISFDNLSITVFANNIILHTKYTGVDPETSLLGSGNGQGLDYFNNPGIKTIGFRVTAGL